MVRFFLFLLCAGFFVSCAQTRGVQSRASLPLPRAVSSAALVSARGPVRVEVSLASFTAQLLDSRDAVLAEMDVSPGLPGHATPRGRFRISEKMVHKRSNLYGQYVHPDTREVLVARAWEHVGPQPKGSVYQGIAMPFWMRLTGDGVGMHVGGFSRGQPSSHGCIRCPEDGLKVFYAHCPVGTAVRVQEGAHAAPSLLAAEEALVPAGDL